MQLELHAHGVAKGRGTEHNIAFNITTGAQSGYQHRVEGLERRLDIAFEHAMQLNTLARGQANIAFAHLIAQGVVNSATGVTVNGRSDDCVTAAALVGSRGWDPAPHAATETAARVKAKGARILSGPGRLL